MPEMEKLPPISHEPISIVLLAHNEAGEVGATVAGWLAWLDARGDASELIVVDDSSADDTDERLRAVAHPRLRVLVHDNPHGVGAALRTGLRAAMNPLVFYTLCDPNYRPDYLTRFFDQRMPGSEDRQIDHLHLMTGFRAGTPMPVPLRITGWLWRALARVVLSYPMPPLPGWLGWRRTFARLGARIFFGIRYHDISCPARLLRRNILRRIPIQSDGPMAHVELLAKANFLGCILGEEVPLDVVPEPYRGDAGAIFREARQLFNKPDFGPAVLPET